MSSGINIRCKGKAKEAIKLSIHISSYLFEQECGELKNYATQLDIEAIKNANHALARILERSKK